MTKFRAQIGKFKNKTAKRLTRLYRESLLDLLEACQNTAQSITSGGVLIEGRIPVLSSDLTKSLVSSVNGAGVATGESSYQAATASFDPTKGDTARYAWTMAYAMRVHSGFVGTDSLGRTYNQPGWQYVSYNVARWSNIVNARMSSI